MQTPYRLSIPSSVLAGAGCAARLSALVEEEGASRIAVFADAGALQSGSLDEILDTLKTALDSVAVISSVPPEPEDRQVREIFGMDSLEELEAMMRSQAEIEIATNLWLMRIHGKNSVEEIEGYPYGFLDEYAHEIIRFTEEN